MSDGTITTMTIISPDRQHELEEIRLETDALDVGEFPQNEDMALVCKYMRHRQRLTAEAERIKEMSGKMLAAIDSRLSGLDYVYMGQVAAIVGKLIQGQKQKSIKTPWGTLGFRKQGKHLEIQDETVLLPPCKQNENPLMWDLVVTTESISKEKLKEYFERTGELPDGVEIVPETEKFYAR